LVNEAAHEARSSDNPHHGYREHLPRIQKALGVAIEKMRDFTGLNPSRVSVNQEETDRIEEFKG